MSNEPDANAVTSAVLSDLIKSSFTAVAKGASGAISSAWDKVFEDFAPYMEETYHKNKNVRILCQKEKDVDLYSVYINSTFSIGDKIYSDNSLMHEINDGNNMVVIGNGGAGKTFFMRHLWLTLFESAGEKTPIFVELRQMNEFVTVDLKSFIRRTISRHKELSAEVFDFFCNNGRFYFLLDGFDEVPEHGRDALQKNILDLATTFPECVFVVSSRHENVLRDGKTLAYTNLARLA